MALGWCLAAGSAALAQFTGFQNKGLVAVGRLSGESFDALGPQVDSLGGIFSGAAFEVGSWARTGDAATGWTYRGRLLCAPDRNVGSVDFHPRVHTLNIEVTPYFGTATVAQTQIILNVAATQVLTTNGTTTLTGATANDATQPLYPKSTSGSVGQGRRSMDCEGISLTRDGGCFLCDEYGAFVFRFDAAGVLVATLSPPAAWIPRIGAAYGSRTVDFSGNTTPTSGRKVSSGLEGVAVSPDERRLFAILQSPLMQDHGGDAASRNTRLLVFDIAAGSPTRYLPIAEYVYQLTLNGNEAGTRQTLASDMVAINGHQLLVLERDARGRNGSASSAMLYKRLVLIDTDGATNLAGTGYDLEAGAPGQTNLPLNALPSGITPVARQDLVDMLDAAQLGKFGLNLNATTPTTNTILEKWEAMTLMPLNDPATPSDYLLLVGADNDFRSSTVYHNGIVVGTNSATTLTDHLLLAWRVTLPGLAFNAVPTLSIAQEGATLRLTWPYGFPHYDLQTSATLIDPWETVPVPANPLTQQMNEPKRFFRLHEP